MYLIHKVAEQSGSYSGGPEHLVVPPPMPRIFDYPIAVGIGVEIFAVAGLLLIAGRFDTTGGSLTVSLLITLTFCGTVAFSLFFTVPQDQTTSAVIGGLVAGFGAVITYWLKPKDKEPPHNG